MSSFDGNIGRAEHVRPVRLAAVLCAVQFVDVLGVTVVVTALPSMLTDLGATAEQGALVLTAYAACFGGLLMLASRVGDRLGHRRLVLAAIWLFAVASLAAALAPDVWVLAVARALQGVAAAASVPSALRLLTTLVPEGEARRRAVAGWSAAGAAAGASGFVVGGMLTEALTWRAVFWVNVAVAIGLVVSILWSVPADRPADRAVVIPWRTAGLLTVAAVCLVAGPTALAERSSIALGLAVVTAGLAAALAFWVSDTGADSPLLPPAARRSARIRWGTFGSFANTATTSSSVTVATLHLQGELGLSPMRAAGTLVSFSLLVIAGSAVAPRLVATVGWRRSLGAGLAVIAVGNAVFASWPSVMGVAVAAGLSGLGIGIGSVAATDLGTHVDEELKATAAGILNTAAQLGTAVGTAVVLLLATATTDRLAWLVVLATAGGAAFAAARRGDETVA